jgi:hypothetical protein
MRITDIIGKPVWHESGSDLGTAHDVRAVQVREFGQPAPLQVTGIVAGKGSLGVRLGYGSPEQRGPAMLKLIFGRRARRTRYIPWQDLRVEPDRIIVTAALSSLQHPRDIETSQ